MKSIPAPLAGLTTLKTFRRNIITLAGMMVLAVGIALVLLPSTAFLLIPAGLAILAIRFARARRWLRSTTSFATRSARFFLGDPRDTIAPKKEAASFAGRHRLPEKAGGHRAPKSGGHSTMPSTYAPASMDAEALSRLEGEGGHEAPRPIPMDDPIDNDLER